MLNKDKVSKRGIVVAVSGYFNPLHVGHLEMIEGAKMLGDHLIAIVNNDKQVKLKGSVPFMGEKDRMKIVGALKAVDKVVLSIDRADTSQCRTLAKVKPNIFANGGDRATTKDIPEAAICRELGIKMVFGVGKKIRSSSILIKNAATNHFQKENTAFRPWGFYTVLLTGRGYKVKKFVVKPGASLSLQSHQYRSEHWVVVSGKAKIQQENKIYLLNENQSTFTPKNCKHRISNCGKKPLEIIEIQSGDYLAEDDIVRYDDKYGRI